MYSCSGASIRYYCAYRVLPAPYIVPVKAQMSITQETPFQLRRLGLIMESNPNDPAEAWGVLNPASARKDGELFLFPRVVAEGNYSRIGIARVRFGENGDPQGVERLGYALEPETDYERHERYGGGVEDPRVTWVEPLGCWVMVYVALTEWGPRLALAVSHDVFHWQRLGLLTYEQVCSSDFDQSGNKDGAFFPDVVLDPDGRPALAILHRPMYLIHKHDGTISLEVPCDIKEDRESIWIGYISLTRARQDIRKLTHVYGNQLLAVPQQPWESLKIGGGTPPVRVPDGWLTFYHGVSGSYSEDPGVPKHVVYSAGAMVLDARYPTRIVYRSIEPVLQPDVHLEQYGIVPNVVFPTAVDQRENGRLDVYYGMADSQIGAATTEIPERSG
jgi:beta-1,2-mannobiose phosphorylase / 1,2-beta-oligomannan phosphorylase